MKFFEELLKDNFELVKVKEFIDYIQPTKFIVKSDKYNPEFKTPVLTANQKFILGYTNEEDNIFYSNKENPVIIFDDFTTDIKWVDFDFKVKSSAIKILVPKNNDINIKFFYYWLNFINNTEESSKDHKRHWISIFAEKLFPLPPLELQNKIVNILDTFSIFSAELKAELKARDEQYKFYRDKLLSNGNLFNDASIIEKKLYEVTIWDKVFAGLPKENQLKNDVKYDYLLASEIEELKDENGDIKILTTYPSTLYTSTNKYNNKIYNEEVIAIPGGSSTMHIQYHNGKFITSDNRICKSFDTKILNTKYLYFYLNSMKDTLFSFYRGSGIKHPYMPDILKLKIKIPSLKIQEKIVEILDNFETVCKDLNIGLPTEIEKRQQQYEFYRDQIFYYLENNTLDNRLREREREREEIVKILLYIFDNIQINFDILIKIERGERITKKDLTLDGFNVKSGGQGYLGKYTKYNRNGNQIVIAEFGTAGLVQWEKNKFWANDVCLTLKLNNELVNEKFLFYFLKSKQHNIFENNIKAVPEKLNKQFLNNLKLIVPKLEVQNKIASVLDNFEAICKDLNIGLPTEIEKRQQQYEFYRDQIFYYLENNTLDNRLRERERESLVKILLYIFDVIEIKIQEIATLKRGRVISKKEIKQSGGKYPVYSSQTENDGILGYINTYDFDGEYLTWTTDGAKAGTVFYRNGQFNITNVCGLINPIPNIINPKFLYYFLTTKTKKYVNKNIANAKLMSNVMGNIKILLPNLNIQNKIVNILNTFENISRNINVGLPTEINLREKQYTYYLNKIFNILNKN